MDSFRPLGDGWFVFDDGGTQRRAAIAGDGQTVWVFLDALTYTVTREERIAGSRSKSAVDVMAPMPATVVSIAAALGQSVAEGDTLIVLEAMKMELPIKASRAGVVKAIHCAKGDLVQPGVPLVEFE